jgi:hypothetical protein
MCNGNRRVAIGLVFGLLVGAGACAGGFATGEHSWSDVSNSASTPLSVPPPASTSPPATVPTAPSASTPAASPRSSSPPGSAGGTVPPPQLQRGNAGTEAAAPAVSSLPSHRDPPRARSRSAGEGIAWDVERGRARANVGGTTVLGGEVGNASRVVAGMRGRFRKCYRFELVEHPDARGSIDFVIRVGPSGEVRKIETATMGDLGSVVACARSLAQKARFDRPTTGNASIRFSVTFLYE